MHIGLSSSETEENSLREMDLNGTSVLQCFVMVLRNQILAS